MSDFFIYKVYSNDKYYCHVDRNSDTEKVFKKLKKQPTHQANFADHPTSIVLFKQIYENSLQQAKEFLRIYEITNYVEIEAAQFGRTQVVIKKVASETGEAVREGIISKELSSKIKTKQVTKQDIKICMDYFYNLKLHTQSDLIDQSIVTDEELFAIEVKQKYLNDNIKPSPNDMHWCKKCSMFMLHKSYTRHKTSGTHLINSEKYKKSKKPKTVD
tara:strand:- start:21 stop:668 length:648 start_codon:yes stop_codon:yes gene_type:complete